MVEDYFLTAPTTTRPHTITVRLSAAQFRALYRATLPGETIPGTVRRLLAEVEAVRRIRARAKKAVR